jgi:hypothetical protein
MGFDRNGVLLVLPESSEHGPTERQGQQGNHLTESLSLAEMGGFEVEASSFERREQRLNAPSQAVIRQCALRAVAGCQNQQFTILEASGDDIDATTPDPTFARQNPLLADR